MCAGRDFSGTFRKCTFVSCTLYIVHGASAAISGCTWRDCPAGIVAHGLATTATLTNCTLRNCRFCIIAEAGAIVAMRSCMLTGGGGVAAAVVGAGSRVAAEDTDITGVATGNPLEPPMMYGVHVCGGSADLRSCRISHLETGVVTIGRSSRLQLTTTVIKDCHGACVLKQRALGSLANSCIRVCGDPGRRPEDQVYTAVAIEDSRVQLTRCEVRIESAAATLNAVHVTEAGRGALHLCRLESGGCGLNVGDPRTHAVVSQCEFSTREVGCMVRSPGSTLHVRGGVLTSRGVACLAHNCAKLSVADACLKGGTERLRGGPPSLGAVTLFSGSSGHILRCRIHDSLMGVHVQCTRARVVDTHIFRMVALPSPWPASELPSSQGIICKGGEVHIAGGSIADCIHAVHVTTGDLGVRGALRMHDVTVKQYSVGVKVGPECAGEISGCRFMGDAGISAHNKRTALAVHCNPDDHSVGVSLVSRSGSVRDCEFDGNACGVAVAAVEAVHIERCAFRSPTTGRTKCVQLASKGAVEDCEFTAGHCAVSAQGASAVCAVRRCTVSVGVESGVGAVDGAHASVIGCTVKCGQTALFVGRGGAIAAQDCVCCGQDSALLVSGRGGAISAKRVKVHGKRNAALASQLHANPEIARNSPSPSPSKLKLVECELSGGEAGVMAAGSGVGVSLLRCRVARSDMGVVAVAGASVRVSKSHISRCRLGILVGDRDTDVSARCTECGHQGAKALEAAWAALTAARTPAVGDRLCVHMGTRARATLDGVAVRRCHAIGVTVTAFGHMVAHGVRVSARVAGFKLVSSPRAECSTLSDCTAVVYHVGEVGGDAVMCPAREAAADREALLNPQGVVSWLQIGPVGTDVVGGAVPEGVRVVGAEDESESEESEAGGSETSS